MAFHILAVIVFFVVAFPVHGPLAVVCMDLDNAKTIAVYYALMAASWYIGNRRLYMESEKVMLLIESKKTATARCQLQLEQENYSSITLISLCMPMFVSGTYTSLLI